MSDRQTVPTTTTTAPTRGVLSRMRLRIHDQTNPKRMRAGLVLGLLITGVVLVTAAILATNRWSCDGQHRLLSFAGSNDRLVEAGYVCASPGQGLWVQSGAAVVYGLVGAALMFMLWPERIHIKPLQTLNGDSQAKPLALAVVISATLDLLENAFTAWALASAGPGEHVGGIIAVVPLLAWTKWLLLGASAFAMTMIALVWIALALENPWTRVLDVVSGARAWFNKKLFGTGAADTRSLFPESHQRELPNVACLGDGAGYGQALPDVLGGKLGICCSGGGIRSAAFNLGALGALEEARVRPAPADNATVATQPPGADEDEPRIDTADHGVHGLLGEARYLASVSGGGYAASAWRTAAGTGRLPARRILGSPYTDDSPEIRYPNSSVHGDASNLYQFTRRHRHYLKNGRGGLLWSGVRTLGRMALHATMVVGVVFTIGWPLGRLAGSWIVADAPPGGFFDDSWEFEVADHHWAIIQMVLVGVGVVFLARLFTRRTWQRRRYDQAALVFLSLLTALVCVLVIVPWVLANLVPRIVDGRAGQSSAPMPLASASSGDWPAANLAAEPNTSAVFSSECCSWPSVPSSPRRPPARDRFFTLGWLQYFLILGVLAVAAVLANPDSWSLHGLYRRKLAETFATRIVYDEETGTSFVVPLAYEDEPGIEQYQRPGTEGPSPIICCAAARVETTKTGIAALSMTFTPDTVQVHGLDEENESAGATSAASYRQRLVDQRVHLRSGTLTGLAAVSGAAVAPSMGRLNMKSTNALLAALNVRLGVWLPNPAGDPDRDMAPRLINMFKELLGWYDLNEEVVYVSDGGHWENLALVEVIRAADPECDFVICIDVSGDAPGSFKMLREAIKLARMELNVIVNIADSEWEAITNMSGPAARNFAHGTIHRPGGKTATLLYVKAAIADNTPLDIQRFASEDAKFPNYSTGDQFLTDREYTNLAKLGYHTMWSALCHSGVDVFGEEVAALFQAHSPTHPSFAVEIDLTDVARSRLDLRVPIAPTPAATVSGMFINGEWIQAQSGATFSVTNPATGAVIGEMPDGGAADASAAIAAADAAFASWSTTPAFARADLLMRAWELMGERANDLAELMTTEQGKPLKASRFEVGYAADFIRWFAEEARRLSGSWLPSGRADQRFLTVRQPVGVVAAVTPWNYPISMLTRKMAPALAAGCTLVLKPAEATPLCAKAVFDVFTDAGVPPGVINMVTALDPVPIGDVFTSDQRVQKLTFTGSTAVGRVLAAKSGASLQRISVELGGHAPFIVYPDADPVDAAKGAAALKFLNSGQACISPNRLYVHRDAADSFIETLTKRVTGLTTGNGMTDGVGVGPLVNDAAVAKVAAQVEDARAKGAGVPVGGHRMTDDGLDQGHFYAPTILTEVTPDMTVYREETFGPVAPVVIYDDVDEVIELANDTHYGLAAYVYTQNLKTAITAFEALRFGIIGINDVNPTSASVPFGGMKDSGLGREGGHEGLDEYLETKTAGISLR